MKHEMVICPKCGGSGRLRIEKKKGRKEPAQVFFIKGELVSESEWNNYK